MATAYNKHDKHSKSQYGGTAVMALGTVTGTVDDTDIDPTGLGRWASVRMTGRGGKKVQIVSAYNPNKTSGRKYKPDTVYSRQKRFFLKNNRAGCPRELFIEDIIKEITAWKKIMNK